MTELARDFYVYLTILLAANPFARVHYREMAMHFRPNRRLSWRGGPMHAALGEIVEWCHANNVEILPAIVVRAKTGRPGDGFFTVALPGVTNPIEQREQWRGVVERIAGATFPPPPVVA